MIHELVVRLCFNMEYFVVFINVWFEILNKQSVYYNDSVAHSYNSNMFFVF